MSTAMCGDLAGMKYVCQQLLLAKQLSELPVGGLSF
jgi:hypothetical protein